MFPFVVAFANRSTKYEKTEPITKVHTRYSEIRLDVTGYVRQRAWGGEGLGSLESRSNGFKIMSVEMFD